MNKGNIATRIVSITLSAALIVCSPGLNVYQALAASVSVSGNVGAPGTAWAPAMARVFAGLDISRYEGVDVQGIRVGTLLSPLQKIGLNTDIGMRISRPVLKRLESLGTPESFNGLPSSVQEALVMKAVAESAADLRDESAAVIESVRAGQVDAAQAAPLAALAEAADRSVKTAVAARVEKTDTTLRRIAKALGLSQDAVAGDAFQKGMAVGSVQLGVDPKTLVPVKDLSTLEPGRMRDAVRYGGDHAVKVDQNGVIQDGHHRAAAAIAQKAAVDVEVASYAGAPIANGIAPKKPTASIAIQNLSQFVAPMPIKEAATAKEKAVQVAKKAASWTMEKAPWIQAALPLAAVAAGPLLGFGAVPSLLAAGSVLGSWIGMDIAKDALKRTGLEGKAYAGALALAVLGAGAVVALAVGSLAAVSPIVTAIGLSTTILSANILTRLNTPKAQVVASSAMGSGSKQGLFTVLEQDGKKVLVIEKGQLGKPYMLSATYEKGIGENRIYSSWLAGEFLWTFERIGDHIQLVMKNTKYQAAKGTPMARTIERSIPDSTVVKAKIVSEDSASGAVAVSVDELFLQDILNNGAQLSAMYPARYDIDPDLSRIETLKVFPKNVEISAKTTFSGQPGMVATTLPDARNITLVTRYSLSALPEGDYAPRKADDRIGFFSTVFQDWTDTQRKDLTTRYINRWKIEKVDPKAALSPVKEPVVFWLENTIPVEYREAVARGVLAWNKAFEKIGYKDAIVVKVQPDNPTTQEAEEFDPADARFNVIRWFLNTDDFVLAIGPSRANPMTGQLYNAGIGFHAAFVRPGTLFEFAEDDSLAAAKGEEHKEGQGHVHSKYCTHAKELAKQAASAYSVMESRGNLTPEAKKRFIEDYITETIIHEVGHTLGLRHNFRASTWKTQAELEATQDGVITASVMDYTSPNIAAPGKTQGSYFQTEVGPYDYWAIEYAYKDLSGLTPQEQENALAAIAARAGEPGLDFATDEDLTGMDPTVQTWDLGKDPLEFARNRVAIARELWARLEKREPATGEGYAGITAAFMRAFNEYYRAVNSAAQYIGGIIFHRNHAGDKAAQLPYEPVSAQTQRDVMDFLSMNVFSDEPFRLSPELLRKLAPSRLPTVNDPYPEMGFTPVGRLILTLQASALQHLLGSATFARLQESRGMLAKGEEVFSVQELVQGVVLSIWGELFMDKSKGKGTAMYAIPEMRRNLQLISIDFLINAAYGPGAALGAAGIVQQYLMILSQQIEKEMKETQWAPETQAHLLQSMMKVQQGLQMGPLAAARSK